MTIIETIKYRIYNKRKLNFTMKNSLLLAAFFAFATNLNAQVGEAFQKMFEQCDNDSLFLEENGVNNYEILTMTESEKDNSSNFADMLLFSSEENSVIGPYAEGASEVWYKIQKIHKSKEYGFMDILLKPKNKKSTNAIFDKISGKESSELAIYDICTKYQEFIEICEYKQLKDSDISAVLEMGFKSYKNEWFLIEKKEEKRVFKLLTIEENPKASIDYLKLIRKPKFTIDFPVEPVRSYERLPFPELGSVPMEIVAAKDSSGSLNVMSFELSNLKELSAYSDIERGQLLEGLMSFLISDIGFKGIEFDEMDSENQVVRRFSNYIEKHKFIMKGHFVDTNIYLIVSISENEKGEELVDSFKLN